MSAYLPGQCDDGEEPYAQECEASLFRGRGDEWFLLEWWGASIGYVASSADAATIYASDSGPMQ